MMRYSFLTSILVCFIFTHVCLAQDNPLIDEGIKQYNDLEYENSINTLSAALIRPGNSDEQKIAIYQYLGLNYLILGREEEAKGAFRSLLVIDEDWSFDPVTTPPKFLEFFEKVKEEWIAEGKPGLEKVPISVEKPVKINHKVPDKAFKNDDINLKIELENPKQIPVKVIVFYKHPSDKKFKEALATMKGYTKGKTGVVYMATIPADDVKPTSLDYYIDVMDTVGNLLNNKGDESVPLRIPVPEEARKKRGLLWGLVGGLGGAAVIGIVLGIALPLALKEEKPPVNNHEQATVTIEICEQGTPGC